MQSVVERLPESVWPEEIGPVDVHVRSGVVDLLADDEAQAIALARRYLSYFGPPVEPGRAPDPLPLRTLVPENPRRAYDVRKVIQHLADVDSVQELKPQFALDFYAEKLGRPHQMRLGARALYTAAPASSERIAAAR